MKKAVSREDFDRMIQRRPSLVRTLVGADDDLVAKCLLLKNDTASYFPEERLNLPVLEKVINRCIARKKSGEHYLLEAVIICRFPEEVRNAVSDDLVKGVIRYLPDYAEQFPRHLSYDYYLEKVKGDFYPDLNEIPEEHRTEELVAIALSKASNKVLTEFPGLVTDAVIDRALSLNPEIIGELPEDRSTPERIRKALKQANGMIDVRSIKMPWDRELADLCWNFENNLVHVPEELVTDEMCETVEPDKIYLLPKGKLSRKLLLKALLHGGHLTDTMLEGIDKDMILEASREAGKNGLDPMFRPFSHKITADMWPKVIAACPKALEHLSKQDQTPEIVDVFLRSASLETIDNLSGCINLSLIRKEQVPLLVGCRSEALRDLTARKLKGPEKFGKTEETEDETAGEDEVLLNLRPAEYRELRETFGI